VYWLQDQASFAYKTKIIWSTGKRIEPGDVQVFAVSATLGEAYALANDPRRDSIHSIWEAITSPRPEFFEDPDYPIQAKFKLRVKLKKPVSKDILYREGVLSVRSWPQSSAGKLLHTTRQIRKLANLLAKYNSDQSAKIFKALNLY